MAYLRKFMSSLPAKNFIHLIMTIFAMMLYHMFQKAAGNYSILAAA